MAGVWSAAGMAITALTLFLSLSAQIPTSERPIFPARDVIVAYADNERATAVGSALRLADGRLRLHVYTVYRHGVALSGGRTPAYSDEWIDFDCSAQTLRVFRSSFYRPNADTIEATNTQAPFVSDGDLLRQHQLATVCGTSERPRYSDYFLFMEAYGLNDGRMPRSRPGPNVP